MLLSFNRLPRERVLVISTHLARNPEDSKMTLLRAKQIAQLMKHLTDFVAKHEAADVPVVMMGDLNAAVFGEIRGMARAIFQLAGQDVHSFLWRSDDVQTGATSVTSTRDVRIDAVMYQPTHLKVLEVYTPEVKEKIPNEEHPSDHVPVYVAFQVKADHKRRRETAATWLQAIMHSNQKVPVLPESEIHKAFEYFDREHAGKINEFDMEESVNNLRIDLSTEMQFHLLKCYSHNKISWADFLLSYHLQLSPDRMQGVADLEKCFEILDSSGRGAMTLQDIKCIFNEISPTKYPPEEVDTIMKKIQTDADGFVDHQLFTIAVLKGYAHPHSSSDQLDNSDSDEDDDDDVETRVIRLASESVTRGRSAIKKKTTGMQDPIQKARLLKHALERFQAFVNKPVA